MTSISETIKRLSQQRAGHTGFSTAGSRLVDFHEFGSNPGELTAKIYVPPSSETHPALVVVLHGCTQSAAAYDHGSGWSRLAEEHGFIVLFPEQIRSNNVNLCFNWFEPNDIARGHGETQSIVEMIRAASGEYSVDPKRIFITGLSAGGAMANVLLATHPEVFAGGAIIAGLPYGAASSVPEALERMRGSGLPSGAELSFAVMGASAHKGPWPTVSVWNGSADYTVSKANADALVQQWCGVHGLDYFTSRLSPPDAVHHIERWTAEDGFSPIELHTIERMGHGTPIDTKTSSERASPFMLDVGISSTEWIAREWGLTPSFSSRSPHRDAGVGEPLPERPHAPPASGIQAVIEKALRSAGLMP